MICFAHRGASGHEPENTLRAVRRALELGARWIEVDVRLVDGELVVFHDEQLDRTTDGTGLLADLDLATLRALDAGGGEPIPLLGEILDAIGSRAGLNIELKGPGTAGPVSDLCAEYRRRHGWSHERLLISSFDWAELAEVGRRDSGMRLGALVRHGSLPLIEKATALGAYSIHIALAAVDPAFVTDAHAHGLQVYVFTVNTVQEARGLAEIGVDGIFSDYPDLMGDLGGPGE